MRIRPGNANDIRACHDLLWISVTDFAARNATPLPGSADDWWRTGESIHRFLAEHSAEWWVAEEPETGELVGYARSVERDGLFELTEFFVLPGSQSAGLGKQLMERAFPAGRGDVRVLVATGDVGALARYYGAGLIARFPILSLSAAPQPVRLNGRWTPVALDRNVDLREVVDIEREVIGYVRSDAEFRWLLSNRDGYLYGNGGRAAGYAFVGRDASGPIAALDPVNVPEILLHVEGRAAALGIERLELEVPSLNGHAIRHLLGRGFKLSAWINYIVSDRPFGQFDRYVCFSPPIVL